MIRERLFVKEDVGIIEALVEAVLHLLDALCHAVEIAIARQHDDDGVGPAIPIKVSGVVLWPVVILWDDTRILLGRLSWPEEARDGCGIAICLVRYGEDEVESELEKGRGVKTLL